MLGEHMIISIVLSFFNLKFFHGWQLTCSYSEGLCNELLQSVIEYELLLTVIARVRNKSIGNILDSDIKIYCQEFKLVFIFYCILVVLHQKSQMSFIFDNFTDIIIHESVFRQKYNWLKFGTMLWSAIKIKIVFNKYVDLFVNTSTIQCTYTHEVTLTQTESHSSKLEKKFPTIY